MSARLAPKQASSGSVIDFPLPEIGEGVVEGEVVSWHVGPGDKVEMDTPVVAILTDKATVDISSPAAGEVVEVFGKEGDMVVVGETLMKLATDSPAAAASQPAEATKPAAAPKPVATAPAARAVSAAENPSVSAFGTPLATPAVRRKAAKAGGGPLYRGR